MSMAVSAGTSAGALDSLEMGPVETFTRPGMPDGAHIALMWHLSFPTFVRVALTWQNAWLKWFALTLFATSATM